MTMMTTEAARTLSSLIQERQEELAKTDAAIAADIGLARPGAFTLMKLGDMRLPITLVPALAVSLDVLPETLLRLVMQEQLPDTLQVIDEVFNPLALTDAEKRLVLHCRKLSEGREAVPIVFDGGPIIALVTA